MTRWSAPHVRSRPRPNRPSEPVTPGAQTVSHRGWRDGVSVDGQRAVPEETAIALVYEGATLAVMMATPADLEDFAVGFSLTEGIVDSRDEIESLEVIVEEIGVELRMRLAEGKAQALAARRRHIAGPVGCGLCGIESLAEAMRPVPRVSGRAVFLSATVLSALGAMRGRQQLHRQTQAVHAAALWTREGGLVSLREDIGRHNALDKLAGALAMSGTDPRDGLVLLTSRLSVEMVQKAAVIGASTLVAVSAPTGLAIRTADAAGITLVAVARRDGFEVFTHPERITGAARDVAS
ncbi:MAG: formate dehydrogenase accessory sulfurtransferase FdhD [Hyphomicrobiales bacterium]|nr:formate dehydrogenase accessory sulfurtransferase FdhD [Hyphomicrobiales bacterium]